MGHFASDGVVGCSEYGAEKAAGHLEAHADDRVDGLHHLGFDAIASMESGNGFANPREARSRNGRTRPVDVFMGAPFPEQLRRSIRRP